MAEIPQSVRADVVRALFGRFDELRWEELSNAKRTANYSRFVSDPDIGGRLTPFKSDGDIRVWIKDGPAKEYRRALEGIGLYVEYTSRAYPGPEEVVKAALGDGWEPQEGSIEEKPMRCLARGIQGQTNYVIWGDYKVLRDLVWNAILYRSSNAHEPITLAVTKPTNTPIPAKEWEQMNAIGEVVRAECRAVTHSVKRKPAAV